VIRQGDEGECIMNDQFGLVLLVIVIVILAGGFFLLARGRRPRSPGETEAQAGQDHHDQERRRGNE
jgi:hypothetical protein